VDKDDTDNILEFTKLRMREQRKKALPVGAKPNKGAGNPNKRIKKGKYKTVRNAPVTDKMEAYAQRLAAGEHYIEAFKKVYDCSSMAPDTTAKYSNRVKNHPAVKERTLQLQRQIRRALDNHTLGLPAATTHMPEPMQNAIKKEMDIMVDVVVTRQWIIKEQIKNMQLARETGQSSAAVAAVNAIAKIEGFDQDGREKQVTDELMRMSPEELKSYIREELSKTGAVTQMELGQLVDMRAEREEG